MRLEVDTLSEGERLEARLRRARQQIAHQRTQIANHLERRFEEVLETFKWAHERIEYQIQRSSPEVPWPERHGNHFATFGEIQGNAAKIDSLAGALQMLDEVIELLDDVAGVRRIE